MTTIFQAISLLQSLKQQQLIWRRKEYSMFNLTNEKFKKAATSLNNLISSGVSLDGSSQVLQAMSQAFFSKPYEEVAKTILNESSDKISSFRMFGIEKHFVFKGKQMIFCHTNTPYHVNVDLEYMSQGESNKSLKKAILKAKSEHGVDVTDLNYSEAYFIRNGDVINVDEDGVLEDFKISEVISSAKMFGYFFSDDNPSLFNALNDKNLFRINGCVAVGSPNDDQSMDECIYDDGADVSYWQPDGFASSHEPMIEFNFSLREIAEAKFDKADGTWYIIPDECSEDQGYRVKIYDQVTK